jgi:D-amino peptidase
MNVQRFVVCLVVIVSLATALHGQDGKKVYISADMEGVVGAVTGDQLGPSGFEYQQFRELMTAEVNAAIEAARRAGASEILVSDSHGNGQNLLLDKLPQDIRLVRSWPRPLMMMEGIDETFDGAIFIGYHTSTTNTEGVRAHTLSSANLTAVRLNGIAVSEAGLNAAIAGHFGVPVLMISGDDAIVTEARELLGDIEGAVVKDAISFHAATTLMPQAALELIGDKVAAAMEHMSEREPFVLDPPIELEVSLKNYRPAQLLTYLPFVEQVDSHTIRYTADDMVVISKFLEFITSYEVSLAP